MIKIGILGGGCFGLALANILIEKNEVLVWWREEDSFTDINGIDRRNLFLPEVTINEKINFSTDINEVVTNSEIVVVAVPGNAVRETLNRIETLEKDVVLVSTSKGIEQDTLLTYTKVIKSFFPDNSVCVLSGPSHAEELGNNRLTAVMIGSEERSASSFCKEAFAADKLIIKESNDPVGMELCAAFKNLVALVMGISDGFECGDNTKSIIFTIGLEEMRELCQRLNNQTCSVDSLAGVGDLYGTTVSVHSRNKKAGAILAKGASFDETIKEINQAVEGINNFEALRQLFKENNIDSRIIKILEEANNQTLTKTRLHEILKEDN